MAWNFGESVASSIEVKTGVELLTAENANFFKAALDEAANMYAQTPIEGSKYFRVRNVDKNNYSNQSVLGIGLAQVNSDAEDLPIQNQQVGFDQIISNYVIRNSMAIAREVLETDRFGVMGDHSRALMDSGERTIERLLADAVNRGFGTATPVSVAATTNLSLLCEDGLALFSGERPQPRSAAGTWSNIDTGATLDADAVASARLDFNTYLDGNGDLSPQMLEKVVVSPDLEDTMREISGSTLRVDTSLNTTNVVSGTPYECWRWLQSGTVVYIGSGENGLEYHVRTSPQIKVWEDGSNPDIIRARLRMALGTGCKRPGKFIGCEVT